MADTDLYAQAAKATLSHGFHFLESVGIQIGRVRIQIGKQTLDRIIDQGLIRQGLHIRVLDGSEHIGELLQFAQRQWLAALSDRSNAQADQNTAHSTCCH